MSPEQESETRVPTDGTWLTSPARPRHSRGRDAVGDTVQGCVSSTRGMRRDASRPRRPGDGTCYDYDVWTENVPRRHPSSPQVPTSGPRGREVPEEPSAHPLRPSETTRTPKTEIPLANPQESREKKFQ